ncbi:GNAT family N-acetyltransferase, partial [Rhodococcus hoagii]|nr:GNAT family N-acetyltransferase [Prescottella equi]
MSKKYGRRSVHRPLKKSVAAGSDEQLTISEPIPVVVRIATADDLSEIDRWESMATGEPVQGAVDLVEMSRAGVVGSSVDVGLSLGPAARAAAINRRFFDEDDQVGAVISAHLFLVAEVDGVVVGALGGGPPSRYLAWATAQLAGRDFNEAVLAGLSGIAKINFVSVDPSFRTRGVGRALVARAIDVFRQVGVVRLYGQFEIARGLAPFYSNLGFSVLEPRATLSMKDIVGTPYPVGPIPSEQLFTMDLSPIEMASAGAEPAPEEFYHRRVEEAPANEMAAADTALAPEELYRRRVEELCDEIGVVGYPSVTFDGSKTKDTPSAYDYRTDEIAIHPELLTGDVQGFVRSYAFEGLIFHELGHRAKPRWVIARRSLVWGSFVLCALASLQFLGFGFGSATALMLLAAVVALVAGWLVAWTAEFNADDYMCDVGGIGRSVEMFGLLDRIEASGTFTHPP